MADGLFINANQLKDGAKRLDRIIAKLPNVVSDILNTHALNIELKAKRAAPADRGQIRQGISTDTSKPLVKHITSHAPHSAYQEFGTGKYAAQYVSSLPPEYQAFAMQFKGGRGDGFKEFIRLLAEWVKRKGLAGTYSTKTRKRTGNKEARKQQDLSVAYAIAITILRNGVHPHPFMVPALISEQQPLINDLKNLVKIFNLV